MPSRFSSGSSSCIACKATEIGPKEITTDEVLLGGVAEYSVEAVAEDREGEEPPRRRRARAASVQALPGRDDDDDDDDDNDAPPQEAAVAG